MKTFIAQFSTGQITRKSEHGYISASAIINRETGQIRNPSFSAKPGGNPSMSWSGIKWSVRPQYGAMRKGYEASAKAHNEAMDKVWKLEIVSVEPTN